MATNSKIEWTESTWNPVVGCTPVSPGCANCYASKMARRLDAMGQAKYRGLTTPHGAFNGVVRCDEAALTIPLRWRKPRRIFVNSMSDLFHDGVPDAFIRKVFAVMSIAGQHTYQVLTKKPKRMAAWFAYEVNSLSGCQAELLADDDFDYSWVSKMQQSLVSMAKKQKRRHGHYLDRSLDSINGTRKGVGDANYWPLPNVWLGTSVEDQTRADERIPWLLKCPAAVRFLSCEPLLGLVDLNCDGVDLVIVGGESGPKARPCNVEWIQDIVRQCKAAGVPCYVKQLGSNPILGDVSDPNGWPTEGGTVDWENGKIRLKSTKGGDPAEWPEDLRVREMPEVLR